MTTTPSFARVTSAEYLSGLRLRIAFEDGVKRVVDFEPFLSHSLHPNIRKYLDKRLFKSFAVDRGHLHWNDYELIVSSTDLYSGEIG